MSELDQALARWRRETDQVKPSAALMVELHALAAAQSSSPTAGAKVAGAGAVATKTAVVVIAVVVLGVVGLLLLIPRSPGAVTEVPPPEPAHVSRAAPQVPAALELVEVIRAAPEVPAAPALPSVPARPVGPRANDGSPLTPSPLDSARGDRLPSTPVRLARAVESLPLTCGAQRNLLVELIREHGHEDPDAAAAAFARWTLLCRTVSGPAIDTHRWFWPWGVPSGTGSSCETVMTEPSCADGENVSASIESAAECVRETTPGSCARRGARLQVVFASCEGLLHQPGRAARSAVDEALKQLTDEFGPALTPAAWCLNPAAQAEGQRIREGK